MRSPRMFGQVLRREAGVVTQGWRTAVAEVVLLAALLLAFTRLHAATGSDVAAATANAHALQAVEHTLHLNIELAMNRWLTEHDVLIPPAVLLYRLYYAFLVGILPWIFIRHAEVYLHVRRTFAAMTGLALLVFWALPMSPPRFALSGVVDVIAEHDILAGDPSRDMANGANHFSAMPSLHVGWSAGAPTPRGWRCGVPIHALLCSPGFSRWSWWLTCSPRGTTTSSTLSAASRCSSRRSRSRPGGPASSIAGRRQPATADQHVSRCPPHKPTRASTNRTHTGLRTAASRRPIPSETVGATLLITARRPHPLREAVPVRVSTELAGCRDR
jgi:hypothetical protein